MREGEHRAAGEGVALDRGHGREVRDKHAGHQLMHAGDVILDLRRVGGHPVEIQAQRPELAGRRRHERARRWRVCDLADQVEDGLQPVAVKAVLGIAQVQDVDVTERF